MALSTAPASTSTRPASPTVTPLPTDKHRGPGFSLARNTSVRQTPGNTRNGGLPRDASAPRVITVRAEAASPSRVVDRAALYEANDNDTQP